jgi:CheY-like chemotaxis protein
MVRVKAEQKSVAFVSDIGPGLPDGVRVDEKRVRQVLLNLLSNAIKFTDTGKVTLRVRFSPPSKLRFDVEDTGVGIESSMLETIFEPFEQVGEMRRRSGGSGLGLAISRQFVRLMGSEIHVESRIGEGSTFWFELDVPVSNLGVAPSPIESITTGYEGPRKKVLVADDVPLNRAMAMDMLKPLGFIVAEAQNGREALDKIQTLRPDLVLMDMVMPEMDGLVATRLLRQIAGFETLPVIAISASASGTDQSRCLAAGASAFMSKPINLQQLLNRISTLLKLKWIEEPVVYPTAAREKESTLVAPPVEEMAILHDLARRGNMQHILQRAEHLMQLDERYRPFAEQLAHLARGYRSKDILHLVKEYFEESPDTPSQPAQ